MSSEYVIELEGVSKSYQVYSSPIRRLLGLLLGRELAGRQQVNALQHVDLRVRKGETLAIIGRNGSGKSTLLQVLCGILQPDTGRVHTEGRVAALLELGAGFNTEFTGRENIYLSAAVYGMTREQIGQRLPAILDFAEIGEFIDRPVKTYSSGMYVRLAFAVAAHLDADILVVDEALAVGDVYFTQKCVRFLRDFKTRGTLVFVSHDTHSVMSMCDRALWLDAGVPKMLGDAREVSEAYLASLHLKKSGLDSENGFQQGEFGTGNVKITGCRLVQGNGSELHLLDRAQGVTLEVECLANADVSKPILGFFVRDRLGQPLFGDNTLGRENGWLELRAGQRYQLKFQFHLPLLATGDYTVGVSVASGTSEKHVQHHWIYEAYVFKAMANPRLTGVLQLDSLDFIARTL